MISSVLQFKMNYKIQLINTYLLLTLIHQSFCSSLCPNGTLKFDKYELLSQTILQHSSQYQDVMFTFETNSSLNVNLVGYRVQQTQKVISPTFNLIKFYTPANTKWKIQYVSNNGDCLLINKVANITAYHTINNKFQQIQVISLANSAISSTSSNQACSIVRFTQSSIQKVFINKSLSSSLVFQANSLFDKYFIYGIDSSKNLYKYESSNQTFRTIALDPATIQPKPITITNNIGLGALIIITENIISKDFVLTVLNTKNNQIYYSKRFTNTTYNGSILFQIERSGDFVLVRDRQGLVLIINIVVFDDLQVNQVIIDKQITYKNIFRSSNHISISDDLVFVYHDNKMTYFQAFEDILYNLGQLPVAIQDQVDKYLLQNSKQPLRVTLTLTGPSQLDLCYSYDDQTQTNVLNQMKSQSVTSSLDLSGNRIKCPAQCIACAQKQLCTVCQLGYVVTLGVCIYCKGCRTCNPMNTNVCFSCFQPQLLDMQRMACVLPQCKDSNCKICDLTGSCQLCNNRYSLFNGVCKACPYGCSTCTGNSIICKTCQPGFVFYTNSTNSSLYCVECATGCLKCNPLHLGVCLTCNDGYFPLSSLLMTSVVCSACISNCIKCSNDSACLSCMSPYILSSSNKCVSKCIASCLTCQSSNSSACLTCYLGYSLNNFQCINSLACNSTKKCTLCIDGYTLSDGYCFKCMVTDTNCVSCGANALTSCVKCITGFYLNSNNACQNCTKKGCAACLNQDSCYTCKDGFYLIILQKSLTGNCLTCDSNCKTCSTQSYLCTSCQSNYILAGSKCNSFNNVDFNITIDISLSNYIAIANKLQLKMIQTSNQFRKVSTNDFTRQSFILKSLKSGSTILSGSFSTLTMSDTDSIGDGLTKTFSQLNNIDGYAILSSSFSINKNAPSNSGGNGYLNFAIIIPIGITIFILAVLVIWKFCRKQKDLLQVEIDSRSVKDSAKNIKTSQILISQMV